MSPFHLIRVACLCLLACHFPARVCAGTNVVTRAVTSRHASFPASVTAGGDSVFPLLTPDGRYVAFMSNAGNLVTNDNNGADFDIFVRDRINRTTVLVSVAASGTGGGNGVSTLGGISADGRYVVFESEASNLVTGDTNRQSDVFIRDLQLGTTRLISVTTNGVQGKGRSLSPLMSADGSRVLFETSAQNLTPGLPGYGFNLVLWDAKDNSLQLICPLLAVEGFPGDRTAVPAFSADGRWAAFVGDSTNLVTGTPMARSQVYVRDVAAGRTIWASEQAGRMLGADKVNFTSPLLSQDGRRLVFLGQGFGQRGAWLMLYDVFSETTGVVTRDDASIPNLSLAAMTPDGSQIVYQVNDQYYLWGMADASVTLITPNRSGTGPSNGRGQNAVISDDGRYVVFTSDATDLVAEAAGPGFQLYRRDMFTGETVCLSARPDGSPGEDLGEVLPSISADGRWVAFESTDTGLVSGDDNDASDVFVQDAESAKREEHLTPELVSNRHPALLPLTSGTHTTGYRHRFPTSYLTPAFDRAGQKLVFASETTGLVAENTETGMGIYVHDIAAKTNIMVSRQTPVWAYNYGITTDGKKVFYKTYEGTSPTNGPNRITSGIVDLTTGQRQLPTISLSGNPLTSYTFLATSLDGRHVVYGGRPIATDLFWRDLSDGGATKLISAFALEEDKDISPGGRRVVFSTLGSVQLWDSRTGTSRSLATSLQFAEEPRFSANGDFILCRAIPRASFGILTEGYFVYSLVQDRIVFWLGTRMRGAPRLSKWGASQPALSANGRFLVFVDDADGRQANDTNRAPDVYVCDLARGTTNLVSINREGLRSGNGASTFPSISDDGRLVAFLSKATDLTADPVNGKRQVFVRDIWLNRTFLVSQNHDQNGGGNADSYALALSPTGQHLAYLSEASNLVPGDFNLHRDIYLAELPEVLLVDADGDHMDDVWEHYFFGNLERDGQDDSDGDGYSNLQEYMQKLDPGQVTVIDLDEDGLDDAWERRFFASLDRDGTGDFDGDGIKDADEFRLGTSPIAYNALDILGVRWNANQTLRITWRAIPGARYQVQYKSNLSQQQWLNTGSVITATASEAFLLDSPAATVVRRFYRVTKLP